MGLAVYSSGMIGGESLRLSVSERRQYCTLLSCTMCLISGLMWEGEGSVNSSLKMYSSVYQSHPGGEDINSIEKA